MIRLLDVELRRTVSRRAIRLMAALVLLGIIIAGVTAFARSNTNTGATRDRLTREFAEQKQFCLQNPEQFGDGFVEEGKPGSAPIAPIAGPPQSNPEEFCESNFGGENLEANIAAADPRFRLVKLENIVKGIAAPLLILCLLLGATSIGAEWHHRTLTTLLTWEPRRARVFVAKAVSVAILGAALVLAMDLLLGLALWPAAAFRGSMEGTTAHWLRGVAETSLRSAGAGAAVAVIGFSIATLGRNTVAAIGIAFGYFAVLESLIRARYEYSQMWLFTDNVAAWVTNDGGVFAHGSRTASQSGLLLGLYALGVATLAAMAFRTRDIG